MEGRPATRPPKGAAFAAVEVNDLRVSYGKLQAVANVSFTAAPGEVLALLGPNGAGKTSTVETLEGYRRPSSGSVRVLGLDPRADHSSLVRRMGVMLQQGGLYPMMNAKRAARLFASYYDEPRDAKEMIGLLGLADVADTPYKRLSGGEQRRLALLLALLGRPEVVFLDEPTSGVDPAGRLAVRSVIAAVRDEGTCVVLTSHELDEVERLADKIVIISDGEVIAAGASEELASGTEQVRFSAPPELDVTGLSARLGAPVREGPTGEYLVGATLSPELLASLTAWLAERGFALGNLRAGRERLEDVFLRLVGERDRTA
ncbi:MAG: ABC transporter ATP-binding protein [Acidimicrobiales bacterium]